MDERTIGMTITEVSRALHIGVEQLREYARTDPTFPCFSVGRGHPRMGNRPRKDAGRDENAKFTSHGNY